ncbi:MAG: tRNA (N(6)-L-threonylcarbamoyladenosine(37)-C(2))-methylthiotransferase MtaB [Candidatus Omnitrophota bacterium]
MRENTFFIKTLGCKVNQYEEQVIRENLESFGMKEAASVNADVLIVNSCTVTGQADIKTKKLLRKIKKENPKGKVIVTGCYAVLKDDIEKLRAMPEVDMVIPGKDKEKLADILCSALSEKKERSSGGVKGLSKHTRVFLKIQDGCDQKCSYCKINIVRGSSKSKKEDDVIDEVRRLAEKHKEIVLTGICLGAWQGKDYRDLSDLLKKIDAMEEDFRVRLSSIEPNLVDDKLIETMSSSPKICKHLHIPLQSGADKILKMMNRKYGRSEFETLIKKIREKIPSCGITIDMITGFPGETEKDFEETREFIKKIKPSRMHVFTYSDRKGTIAFDLKDKIPPGDAKRRSNELIEMGEKLKNEFCESFYQKNVEILVEKIEENNFCEGYTGEYVRARCDYSNKNVQKGDTFIMKVDNIEKSAAILKGHVI